MNFTTEQEQRFADFLSEIQECQDEIGDWTMYEYCEWLKQWVDKDNSYNGYVKQGGVRPHRPHNP